jgi:hypothetical protein
MVQVSKSVYRQDFFSLNFFHLLDVQDDESVRLSRLNVEVVDYEISIELDGDGEMLFFLHLYFKSKSDKVLDFFTLFGNR